MSCLLCVSFLDRSGVVASIQLDSVLVENAEYGTSASESAGSPDFIYRMSGNIEVHYSLFSVELLRLAVRNRRQRHNHLLLQLDYMLCRFPESKDFVGQRTNHYQYVRWLGFRKQDVVGVNPVVDADDANDIYLRRKVTFRCNMWMLLIVKLLSFKRYNYPFYKCRENEQQM